MLSVLLEKEADQRSSFEQDAEVELPESADSEKVRLGPEHGYWLWPGGLTNKRER